MKKTFSKDVYKPSGINLGPYRNFLKKRNGQSWDRVWAEICRANDSRTNYGRASRVIFQTLVYHTRYDEDSNLVVVSNYGEEYTIDSLYNGVPYVDPEGILRIYKEPKRKGFEFPEVSKKQPSKPKYLNHSRHKYKAL